MRDGPERDELKALQERILTSRTQYRDSEVEADAILSVANWKSVAHEHQSGFKM